MDQDLMMMMWQFKFVQVGNSNLKMTLYEVLHIRD